jgi:hypothetical protein
MSDRETKYMDEDLILQLEYDEDIVYIHHHFFKWSPSVLKKTIVEFNKIVNELKALNHTELWSYYDKDQVHVDKFCVRFGFTQVSETETQKIVLKEI